MQRFADEFDQAAEARYLRESELELDEPARPTLEDSIAADVHLRLARGIPEGGFAPEDVYDFDELVLAVAEAVRERWNTTGFDGLDIEGIDPVSWGELASEFVARPWVLCGECGDREMYPCAEHREAWLNMHGADAL